MVRRIRRILPAVLLSVMIAAITTWGLASLWRAIGGGALSIHGWIALFIGLFGTTGLAGCLMGLAFRSSRDGWDQRADEAGEAVRAEARLEGRADDPSRPGSGFEPKSRP